MKKAVLAGSVALVVCLGSSQVPRLRVATSEIRLQAADPTAPALELLGKWHYGPCEACAIDAGRKLALIGNGETLQVLDISNAAHPAKIGEAPLEGSPQEIEISGNIAYVMTLNYLLVVSIADLTHPSVLSGFFYSGTKLRSLAVSSGRAYVAAEFFVDVFDVSDPYQPLHRGTYRRDGSEFFDVAAWGTYAICTYTYWRFPDPGTRTYGLEVIDVSVASAPRPVGGLDLGKDLVPRDIAMTADGHALVCLSAESMKSGGLAVIDVGSDPEHPSETGRLAGTDGGFEGIGLSGNIAYVFQLTTGRVIAIDVSNPGSPVAIGACATGSPYQCRDLDPSAGLVGISSAGGGFLLFTVASPSSPALLGSYDTPDEVGWCANIAVSGDRVLIAGTADGLRIMDVSDPAQPAEEGLGSGHRLSRSVAVFGNTAYGLDPGRLSIFDISSSASPEPLADLDLPPIDSTLASRDHFGIVIRPPYAYVSGVEFNAGVRRANLTIVNVLDPEHPSVVKAFALPINVSNFGNLALYGNYVYLGVDDNSGGEADRRCGLRTIDVSDPRNPREVWTWRSEVVGSYQSRVALGANRLYLTGDQLRIFDLGDPAAPLPVAFIALRCDEIALSGGFAYLSMERLLVLDFATMAGGTISGYIYRGEKGKGVAVSGNIAYVPGSLSVYRNNVAPSVSVVSPAARTTVLGSVPIEVQASHDSGIRQVEFSIDGSLKAVDANAPYSYVWDTAPYPDGVHTVRVLATSNDGRSSELPTDVFVRHVHTPPDFAGTMVLNRSFAQAEYLNVLSWRAHPDNHDLAKYKLLLVEGGTRTLLGETSADKLEFWHRKIDKEKSYSYALVAVDGEGRESLPAYTTILPGVNLR